MNVISFQDLQLARLNKRAAVYGMSVSRHGDTWALIAHGLTKPETVGTLAVIAADLDFMDELAEEPNDDIVIV